MLSLARQVVGLMGSNKQQPLSLGDGSVAALSSAAAVQQQELTQSEGDEEVSKTLAMAELEKAAEERGEGEALWSKRFFWLCGSTLSWAKHSYGGVEIHELAAQGFRKIKIHGFLQGPSELVFLNFFSPQGASGAPGRVLKPCFLILFDHVL